MIIVNPTSELHNENQAWERDLAHWKEKLFNLNKQVKTITTSWTDGVEHSELLKFNHRFESHIAASRELMLAIDDHEDQIRDDSLLHYNRLSELAMAVHSNLRARVQELRKEYRDIKTEYFEFLSSNF